MPYVWEALSASGTSTANATEADYYNSPRNDLIAMLAHAPRNVLDVGCGGGATGAEIKRLHPQAYVTGIELSPGPAAIAATRLDRVVSENVETLDYGQLGYEPGSIDVVLYPDVLEHLYDPWSVLVKLRPYLSADAQVLASIPNIRNLGLIMQLASGDWQYTAWGLLDVTHIRFFSKKSIVDMFDRAGLQVRALRANCDTSTKNVQVPSGQTIDLRAGNLVLKGLNREDVTELSVIQFLIDAAPAA